jgi:hypothetical protein
MTVNWARVILGKLAPLALFKCCFYVQIIKLVERVTVVGRKNSDYSEYSSLEKSRAILKCVEIIFLVVFVCTQSQIYFLHSKTNELRPQLDRELTF